MNESDLDAFSFVISKVLVPGDTVLLYGDMGAGKTTFTQYLAAHYGIKRVSSPTFSLVNQYEGLIKLNHIDLYRLDSELDFHSFDLDRYLRDKEGITLIEWSEKLSSFMPQLYWKIQLEYQDEYVRKVSVNRSVDDNRAHQLVDLLSRFDVGS